jgi:hypothetical protein
MFRTLHCELDMEWIWVCCVYSNLMKQIF